MITDNLPETEAAEVELLRDQQRRAVLGTITSRPKARYAKTSLIRKTIAAAYCEPAPSMSTLIAWFTEAGVPNAGRGKGHHTFWQVAAAEDCIRAHVGLPTVCQHRGAAQ